MQEPVTKRRRIDRPSTMPEQLKEINHILTENNSRISDLTLEVFDMKNLLHKHGNLQH